MIRKIIVYIFAFVSICLILPVLLVKDKPTEDVVKLDGEVAGTKEVKNSIANSRQLVRLGVAKPPPLLCFKEV